MASITVERLIQHLDLSGYIVMKKPVPPAHSSSGLPHAGKDDRR
jgi:hypothetical protein